MTLKMLHRNPTIRTTAINMKIVNRDSGHSIQVGVNTESVCQVIPCGNLPLLPKSVGFVTVFTTVEETVNGTFQISDI